MYRAKNTPPFSFWENKHNPRSKHLDIEHFQPPDRRSCQRLPTTKEATVTSVTKIQKTSTAVYAFGKQTLSKLGWVLRESVSNESSFAQCTFRAARLDERESRRLTHNNIGHQIQGFSFSKSYILTWKSRLLCTPTWNQCASMCLAPRCAAALLPSPRASWTGLPRSSNC